MKFAYDKTETGTRECVAYITQKGTLVFKTDEGVTFFYHCSWTPNHGIHTDWNPSDATHKFYRGDSVTITF